jgi:TolB-like protein/DNA-binding winged helix-turn-helix (wHTH) protein/tetratricopeptide (TPR) repeat protein
LPCSYGPKISRPSKYFIGRVPWHNRPQERRTTTLNAIPGQGQVVGFGVFEVDRASCELRKQGRRIRLQVQPFQVLVLLLDRAGEVVTREELRQQLWPSSVFVDFDHGLNNAIARLRDALGDSAGAPQFIETLPRLGYRFIYPVRLAEQQSRTAATPEPESAPVVPVTVPQRRQWRYAVAAVLASVLLLLVVKLWPDGRPTTDASRVVASTGNPSIAVLPFVSMSSDIEDEHFADGLSEELLNQLARVHGLQVVGRTSSFYFKGKQESPAVIARALNVDHLLEGSVRRSDGRVRITTQLIDARNGYHLWSQTFDRDFKDIFSVQDEIALAVTAALRVQLVAADAEELRRHGTANPEAYRRYLVAIAQFRGLSTKRDKEGGRRLFEQAIALDPGFAAAYAGLAGYHFHRASTAYVAPEDGALRGRAAAQRAIALAPNVSEALRVSADFEMWRYRFLGEYSAYARADALFRRAIEVDPGNAYAHYDYARAIQWYEPLHAQRLFEHVQELDPLTYMPMGLAALAMSRQGEHDAARQRLQILAARPGVNNRAAISIGTLESYLGRLDLAVEALANTHDASNVGAHITLWSVYMALGDATSAADELLKLADHDLGRALQAAATFVMQARYREAFEHLDLKRKEYPVSRILDLPAARLALIAGESARAREILEKRLPNLADGSEPVNAPHVLPALDLVIAWSTTGRQQDARRLLERIEVFLDGPESPRLPMFMVQRARAYALGGDVNRARQALELAYTAGFRTTCALDLLPQPLLYIDCIDVDPAFAGLHRSGQFDAWLARIHADNKNQLARHRGRLARNQAR